MSKYLAYSKERFPIPGVVLYAGSLFSISYFFPTLQLGLQQWSIWKILLGVFLFFLVFLHLRIFDEHKDYEKDKIAYPNRMLSNGEISLADLRRLLAVALTLEAIISLVLGSNVFITWILVLVWSLLMFKEFFVPVFLNAHLVIYLITHQLLVPILSLIAIAIRIQSFSLHNYDLIELILFLFAIMCLTITYEIARKTWSKDREHEKADSYTKIWGIKGSAIYTIIIAFIGGSILLYFLQEMASKYIFEILSGIFFALLCLTEIAFIRKPNKKFSKMVEAAGAVYMLAMFILTTVGFILA